ncbi:MAG: ethanolamine utilization protein EutJ family protein [Marmoricola sp.]|nr:ethanolamine utilization protein EutJ family protein [Marmoricola sp.]
MSSPQRLLASAASRLRASTATAGEPFQVGVDLGTATCVIVVLDAAGKPLWLDTHPSGALADGVVVDFAAAVASIRGLKDRAEAALGRELVSAATAFPPCVGRAESRACGFVLEGAGFADVTLCDEVSAARMTLGIADGVIVDVGGGSTGVGVFREGELVALDDRPGGGHHLDLIVAGALRTELAVAEKIKRERPEECAAVLRPGFERIAESIRALSAGSEDLEVHLAGGALMFPGADRVISAYLERPVTSYAHADLITPIGIARHAA